MPALGSEDKRRLLSQVPLFSGLPPRELDSLVQVSRVQRLAAREELFHKGDDGAQVYVVIKGKLKALTTSAEGDDVVFNLQGPGEVIGEIALLAGGSRTATVVALERSELLVLDRRDFMACLRREPELAVRLLAVMAQRLARLSALVEDTLFLNLPVRLAKKLTQVAASDGEKTPDGIRIKLRLSQEEWGDLVGATRESINKQMRAWTEQGLIAVDGGHVVIRRPEALETLADCLAG